MPLDLYAGIAVSDFATARDWYSRLFGGPPSFVATPTEAVWELAKHRSVFIEERPEHAGHALHTIFVDDLDGLVAGITHRGSTRRRVRRMATASGRPTIAIPTGTRSASAAPPSDPHNLTVT